MTPESFSIFLAAGRKLSLRETNPRGFTLIEMLVVVAIIAVLAAVTLSATSRGTRVETLDSAASTLVATFSQARADTLASESNLVYGVHIDSGQFVLFSGSTYNKNASSNVTLPIDSNIKISTTTSGAPDVIFSQLTGEASTYGTTTLSIFTGGATTTRIVVVSKSGAVSVQ